MRFASALAASLLVFVTSVQGSLFHRNHERVQHVPRHRHRRPAAAGSAGDNNYGAVYQLVDELGVAIVTGNYSWASSLIADDAEIIVTGVRCGHLSKAEFLASVENQPDVMTRWFELNGWAGYSLQLTNPPETATFGVFTADTAAILAPGSAAANQTFYNEPGILALSNQAGTQLKVFHQYEDTQWRQEANATAMVDVFKQLRDASELRDISAFERILSDEFNAFGQFQPWGVAPPLQLTNKSAVIEMLTNTFSHEFKPEIKLQNIYATCDKVIAKFIWSVVYNNGGSAVNKFAFAMTLDENLRVTEMAEYAFTPFY